MTENKSSRDFQDLLRHVWKYSPFYRDYYGSHGINEKDLSDISIRDLPFLSKKTLMDNFDRAVTDARLKRVELEQWIQDNPDPREQFCREFTVIHSSGVSGEAGIFAYDRKAWLIADTSIAKRLPLPENYPGGKTKVAVYLDSGGHYAMVSIAVRMPASVFDTLIISIMEPGVVNQLNAFQPDRLQGYSGGISDLADLAIKRELRIRPKTILVAGERLTASMEGRIREAWSAPIYVVYGAAESKYIALREPGWNEMEIIDELNIVEVLGEDDRLVSTGAEGRIVLSNLHNYCLPIIRYELGDRAILGHRQSGSAPATIREIKGRINDALPVILEDGTQGTIDPHLLEVEGLHIPSLEKVRYISLQLGRIRIDYVGRDHADGAIRESFQRTLDLKRATKTAFEVRRVERIPSDRRTGKFRLVKIEQGGTYGSESE